jgi:phage tail-like protein
VPSIAAAQAVPTARAELLVDGAVIATFSDAAIGVPGGTLALQPAEAAFLKKLPGKHSPPTVTLKRGKNNSMEMFLWHEAVVQGDTLAARKSCSLVMYNTDGKPVARYHLEMAWPAKIEIGALKAGASEVLMETVVLAADQIEPAI